MEIAPIDSVEHSDELRVLKRAFDVALSALGLVISAPLWAVAALAIKIEDGGPVFYSQDRVGRHGRIFRAWKFRSMVPDAEQVTGAVQATDADPRVTAVGRLLRATALDELPQLWNILSGEMSFVGPRALRPEEAETTTAGRVVALHEIRGYEQRQSVRPGLTGLAQVYAPRDISRAAKFRYDRLYIRRRSFALDLQLILQSVWITLRARWEHRGRKI